MAGREYGFKLNPFMLQHLELKYKRFRWRGQLDKWKIRVWYYKIWKKNISKSSMLETGKHSWELKEAEYEERNETNLNFHI